MAALGNMFLPLTVFEGKLWVYVSETLTHASSQYLILLIYCYGYASFSSFLTVLTFLFSIWFGLVPSFPFIGLCSLYWFIS